MSSQTMVGMSALCLHGVRAQCIARCCNEPGNLPRTRLFRGRIEGSTDAGDKAHLHGSLPATTTPLLIETSWGELRQQNQQIVAVDKV